ALAHLADAADALLHLRIAVVLHASRTRDRRRKILLDAQHDAPDPAHIHAHVLARQLARVVFTGAGNGDALHGRRAGEPRLERALAAHPQQAGAQAVDAQRAAAGRLDAQLRRVDAGRGDL